MPKLSLQNPFNMQKLTSLLSIKTYAKVYENITTQWVTSDHRHTQNFTEDKTIGLLFVQAKYLLSCSQNATVLNTVVYLNCNLKISYEFALLDLLCPFFCLFTDLTTFFCLKILLFLSLILLPIILIIKLKTTHRSSGAFTVHKSSLYARSKKSDCIKKDALHLITLICFRVFNKTFTKWLDSHHKFN